MGLIRLQKYLAQCGIGSRRSCDTHIINGRVRVDEIIIKELGTKIDPDKQTVSFDNKVVSMKPIVWIMLHKPPEYISSAKDPSGKKSFLSLLPENKRHLFAVGRLDYLSEGLLLITNDGEIANKLIHPRYEIEKEYLVRTIDELLPDQLKQMKKGLTIDNEELSVKSIQNIPHEKTQSFFDYKIIISEGKNRHIRRMLAHQHIRIRSLKRVRIGPIHLNDLPRGKWQYLTDDERQELNQITKDD